MEPQIRYCKTSEGLSIAYYAMGAGQPLIGTQPHLGMTIAKDLEAPASRRIAELTSRNFTYVRYDPHGGGLSDRKDADLTVESFVRDLEAAADAACREPFVLFANGSMTAPAIVYAALHPDRLTHLILWQVFAYKGDYDPPTSKQMMELALTDWRLATESLIRVSDNWEHDELASHYAAMMRESVTPETWVKFEQERRNWDVSEWLPQISTPTLVVHPRNHRYFPATTAQRAAAAIPGARLALIESSTVLFPDASIAFVAGEFLGTTRPRSPVRSSAPPSGTAIILFADIADSTALTEKMGDMAFREQARTLDTSLRRVLHEHGGIVIDAKTLGDGVLATFSSASQAIEAALDCGAAAEGIGLTLHLGLHAGDVLREADAAGRDNVFGGAVNVASRISALSEPGEALVSEVVRALARTSASVNFADRGEHVLKGIEEPQRLFAVRRVGAG